MNRILVLGIVAFLAVVGVSLLGTGADWAIAGHGGCCGCSGGYQGGGCHGGYNGYGCHGGHHQGGYGCHGGHAQDGYGCHGGHYQGGSGCHGGHDGGYDQGAPIGDMQHDSPSAPPPAPSAASRTYQRQPFGFRRANFRR